jgi:predicted PhzF superfamily epimerase YddE/YHI9
MAALAKIDCRGIIVTARGDQCDFVSRFFAPRVGIDEDPVTGSSHTVLAPYWARKLGKNELHARQVSARGGELYCRYMGERVRISGRAVLYMEGMITV